MRIILSRGASDRQIWPVTHLSLHLNIFDNFVLHFCLRQAEKWFNAHMELGEWLLIFSCKGMKMTHLGFDLVDTGTSFVILDLPMSFR